MFDTHCHLNFGAFDTNVDEVIQDAIAVGVTHIMVPSTDVSTSRKALAVAKDRQNIFVAVGIHPHHVFEMTSKDKEHLQKDLSQIEAFLSNKKVLAVGEVGIDRHYYKNTRHSNYEVNNEFIATQIRVFSDQVKLAIKHDKSLILHNREAKAEFLKALSEVWDDKLKGRTVFHCCEPDLELLAYAKEYGLYIGVDGDLTYSDQKQKFIKEVPIEMLVLETDSPFLSPEPFRSQPRDTRGPNVPANIALIAERTAKLKDVSIIQIIETTTQNAKKLFGIS